MASLPPERPSLQFKPLSQGLGFHPFSDGLPYAPVAQVAAKSARPQGAQTHPTQTRAAGRDLFGMPQAAPKSTGLGATAAGFARPVPTIHVPTAAPRSSVARAPEMAPLAASQAPLDSGQEFGSSYSFFYSMKRTLAFALDQMVCSGLSMGTLALVFSSQHLSSLPMMNAAVLVGAVLFLAAMNWALLLFQEVAFGTSVGKRLMGLKLTGGAGTTFLRAMFFVPSVGFFGIGLLWAIFDSRRRCWHDLASGVQPEEIARL